MNINPTKPEKGREKKNRRKMPGRDDFKQT